MAVVEAPRLVLVTGPSGAGKTTLARGLGGHLGLPVFVKDDLKEALFDTLEGVGPGRLGAASFRLLLAVARAALGAMGAVVEANFDGRLASGERHPGHRAVSPHSDRVSPLEVGGATLVLDGSLPKEEVLRLAVEWLAGGAG